MAENQMTEAELRDRITQAPFHKWLGLDLAEMTEDAIKLTVPWREEFVVNTKVGYTHGGVLASLIDIAADYALAAKLGGPIPTVDMRVDYHRPAPQCTLTITANVIRLGRTFSTAEAQVYDADGALVASGRGVYHSPPAKS